MNAYFILYAILYFSIGILTVKMINKRAYNIFTKLEVLGISYRQIFMVKFSLYSTWPILWVAFGYGVIRSKIRHILK